MKKINRIISIITSLSLTFVSSVYIVSAKKTIQTIQSSSPNKDEPDNTTSVKKPVIIKSTPPKKGQLKKDPIPYAIDPRITNKHLNLLRYMRTISYMYVVDSIAVALQTSALLIPALQASGIAVPAGIVALAPILAGIGGGCTFTSLITKLVSFFSNQPF